MSKGPGHFSKNADALPLKFGLRLRAFHVHRVHSSSSTSTASTPSSHRPAARKVNEADLLNMRQSPDSFDLTPHGIEVGKCDFTGTPPASSHRELSGVSIAICGRRNGHLWPPFVRLATRVHVLRFRSWRARPQGRCYTDIEKTTFRLPPLPRPRGRCTAGRANIRRAEYGTIEGCARTGAAYITTGGDRTDTSGTRVARRAGYGTG
jgi:hypothetical protein